MVQVENYSDKMVSEHTKTDGESPFLLSLDTTKSGIFKKVTVCVYLCLFVCMHKHPLLSLGGGGDTSALMTIFSCFQRFLLKKSLTILGC
jgi:hypothetical protein